MTLSKALGEESQRLHALLVPPGAEKMVNLKSKEGIRSADKEHLGLFQGLFECGARYLNLSTRYYREELEGVVPDQRLIKLQDCEIGESTSSLACFS